MSRFSPGAIWHSRQKLAISSACLAFSCMLIDYWSLPSGSEFVQLSSSPDLDFDLETADLKVDLDYALETMNYLNDVRNNRAEVKPVFEEERQVVEHYWWCAGATPAQVRDKGWIKAADGRLFLYSAYLDKRPSSVYPHNAVIQILAMQYRSWLDNRTVYCQFHFNKRRSAVVEATVREIWQRAWDPRDRFIIPALVSCPLPYRLGIARELSVTLALRLPCEGEALEHLRVDIQKGKRNAEEDDRKDIAVCVKGMDFQDDNSIRFVEWLEAQYLLGADTVTVYTYWVSEAMHKVLDYYEQQERLEQIPFELPGNSPNFPYVRSSYIWRNRQQKRRHELIPYNDCLYRHINTHRYILIVDTDELMVPIEHKTWSELIAAVQVANPKKNISSISLRNVFKFPTKYPDTNFPEHLYFLRNNKRSKMTSKKGDYGKSFTNTDNVATVFNHYALHRQRKGVAGTMYVTEETAVKLHYKEKCPVESRHECKELEEDTVNDTSLDGFKDELKKRVEETLRKLKFLK